MIEYTEADARPSQGVTACHGQGSWVGWAVQLKETQAWGGLWCDRLFAHVDPPRCSVGIVVSGPFGGQRPTVEVLWGGELVTVFSDRLDPIGGAP